MMGGHVVEELVPEPRTFENADFLFPTIPVVAELKEIMTAFDRSPAIHEGYIALLQRVAAEDPNWRPLLLGGSGEYPKWFPREFARLFRPHLSRVLKKANRQIRETKAHFGIKAPTGMLVFVNDGFKVLEPHWVRALAADLLVNSYSSIDCFLYLTVNQYVEVVDSDAPRLLWMPLYSEKAPEILVEFVDDLGRNWCDFLETIIGPFTVPRQDVPQTEDGTNAFQSRAIVLPSSGQ